MFTCSVSVYSLFAVSFLLFFHSTLHLSPLRLALISVVLLLLFTFIQNLFTSLTFRLCVAVSAHCLLSLFLFCLFHKGKIILSVNMSVYGCMCVWVMIIIIVFVYFFVCFFFDSTCCVTWERIGIFCLLWNVSQPWWVGLFALSLSCSREKMSAQKR